jgi:hypothetical protein
LGYHAAKVQVLYTISTRKTFHLYIIFAMAAKKTKGKQKMEMKSIENQDVRLVTFSKR